MQLKPFVSTVDIVGHVIRMTGFFLQDTDEYANTSESSVMSRLNCPIVNLFVHLFHDA